MMDLILSLGDEREMEERMTWKEPSYHELYLPDFRREYLMPIQFEDGMDWTECELYYASINSGSRDFRGSFHRDRDTRIRRPSKQQLQEQADGHLPTCVLDTSALSQEPLRHGTPSLRRSVSFDTLPKLNEQYSKQLGQCLEEESWDQKARVNFDDYVSVVTITPFHQYPVTIQESLWFSPEEAGQAKREAKREAIKRRRMKEALDQLVADRKILDAASIKNVKDDPNQLTFKELIRQAFYNAMTA